MEKYPKVFIAILNYNGKDVIKNCLKSVFKIDYPNFEVVVVDNNSTDGSLELAKASFSKMHFIKNEVNLGFSTGNNIGIRFALEKMADFVLLLNNDTEVAPDFLEKLIAPSMLDEKIGLSSPFIFKDKSADIWFSGGKINWFSMKARNLSTQPQADSYFETGFVSGCSMLVRKDVFKKIGLLDEDFFLYWEDTDFSVRAQKADLKTIVVPQSHIYHFEKSEEQKANKTYWLVLSGLLFFQKNATFPLNIWIYFYTLLRKLKNFKDVVHKKNDLAIIVQKAYRDFAKINK